MSEGLRGAWRGNTPGRSTTGSFEDEVSLRVQELRAGGEAEGWVLAGAIAEDPACTAALEQAHPERATVLATTLDKLKNTTSSVNEELAVEHWGHLLAACGEPVARRAALALAGWGVERWGWCASSSDYAGSLIRAAAAWSRRPSEEGRALLERLLARPEAQELRASTAIEPASAFGVADPETAASDAFKIVEIAANPDPAALLEGRHYALALRLAGSRRLASVVAVALRAALGGHDPLEDLARTPRERLEALGRAGRLDRGSLRALAMAGHAAARELVGEVAEAKDVVRPGLAYLTLDRGVSLCADLIEERYRVWSGGGPGYVGKFLRPSPQIEEALGDLRRWARGDATLDAAALRELARSFWSLGESGVLRGSVEPDPLMTVFPPPVEREVPSAVAACALAAAEGERGQSLAQLSRAQAWLQNALTRLQPQPVERLPQEVGPFPHAIGAYGGDLSAWRGRFAQYLGQSAWPGPREDLTSGF